MKIQNFPIFKIQTRKLAAILEGLNSSLAQSPDKLWSYKVAQEKWIMRNQMVSKVLNFSHVMIGSGVFKWRQARHLPQAPLEVFRI